MNHYIETYYFKVLFIIGKINSVNDQMCVGH